jgi:hypothetical protein
MKIGDAHGGEQVRLPEFLQLSRALKQEKQLRGQGGAPTRSIDPFETPIHVDLLKDHFAGDARGELAPKAGLADANRALHDDESRRSFQIVAVGYSHDEISTTA